MCTLTFYVVGSLLHGVRFRTPRWLPHFNLEQPGRVLEKVTEFDGGKMVALCNDVVLITEKAADGIYFNSICNPSTRGRTSCKMRTRFEMVLHLDNRRYHVLKDTKHGDGIVEWAAILGITENEIASLPTHWQQPRKKIAGIDGGSSTVDQWTGNVRTPSPRLLSTTPVTTSTPQAAKQATQKAPQKPSRKTAPKPARKTAPPAATSSSYASRDDATPTSTMMPWLHKTMDNRDAANLIRGKPDGTFLVREHGTPAEHMYGLSVMYNGKPTHHRVHAPPHDHRATVNGKMVGAIGIVDVVALFRTRQKTWPVPLMEHIPPEKEPEEPETHPAEVAPKVRRQSVIPAIRCERCSAVVPINEGDVGTPVISGTFEVNITTPIGLTFAHAGSGKYIVHLDVWTSHYSCRFPSLPRTFLRPRACAVFTHIRCLTWCSAAVLHQHTKPSV